MTVSGILYPRIRLTHLAMMLKYASFGALVAGLYGVLHDQVTYAISPEYFTRLKFAQFRYADIGLPRRVFVAEIGFLATWWVGFIAGWFVARIVVPALPPPAAFRHFIRSILIITAIAFAASIVGFIIGALHGPDYTSWANWTTRLGVADVPAFVRVAYIHNAGYLGSVVGLIAAIVAVQRVRDGTDSSNPGARR